MRRFVSNALIAVTSFATLASAPAAFACWDGALAQVGDALMQSGDEHYSDADAIAHATWMWRIDKLLPEGDRFEMWGDMPTLYRGDEAIDLTWNPRKGFAGMFDAVAKALGTNRIQALLIKNMEVPIYTIQAGSFTTERLAQARVDLIGPQCSHGAYEVGGFPAENASAHIQVSKAGHYRVIVGTFTSRDEAEAAKACLANLTDWERDETRPPVDGFVRRLDREPIIAR